MKTRRVRLDIDTLAIESLREILPRLYYMREPKAEAKFTTMVTSKADEDILSELFGQKNSMPLPVFAIRRRSLAYDSNSPFNEHVSKRFGIANLKSESGDVAVIKAIYVTHSLDIILFTADFDVLDHWIKSLLFFGQDTQSFGAVKIVDPLCEFPVKGKFNSTYDYPIPMTYDAFSGWMYTVSLDLFTQVADIDYTPPINEVIMQYEVVKPSEYDSKLAGLADLSPFAFANFNPRLEFSISQKIVDGDLA